jgi:hypothetical protein
MGLVKTWYPNITITNHSKKVAGWRLPSSVPPEVSRGLKNHVQRPIKEIKSKNAVQTPNLILSAPGMSNRRRVLHVKRSYGVNVSLRRLWFGGVIYLLKCDRKFGLCFLARNRFSVV